jgi:integrase
MERKEMTNEANRKLPRGIHQMDDGRFRVYVTRNGKPVRLTVTWELLKELRVPVPPTRLQHPGLELTKAALVKLQSNILEETRSGVVEASAKTKIGDLLVLVEQDFSRAGKRTWEHAKARWINHLKAHFGDVPANSLTTDTIDNYIIARQKEKAGAATINRETAFVKRMLNLGKRTKPPKVANVPHFPHLEEPEARQGFLTQTEYDSLRQHASELWLRALLAIYYTFGWRKTEVLGLRVRQVAMMEGTISLPSSKSKNKQPRIVAMTSEVKAMLSMLMVGKQADDYVFTRTEGRYNGQPIRDLRNAWTAMFEAAGVEPRLIHDMRRSAIMNGIERGVDRDTMKRISGHLTDSVFSRYNIQTLDRLRKAASLIEVGATDKKTDKSTSESEAQVRQWQ